MHRQLRRLDRWYAAQAVPARGGDLGRRVTVLLVTGLICVPAVVLVLGQQGLAVGVNGISRRTGHGPAVAPPPTGAYAFMAHQPGSPDEPVTYDPCRPIHVVENDLWPSASNRRLVDDALHRVAAATGLRFVRDGSTDELPRHDRPTEDPVRYGPGPSPVLIAWTSFGQDPGLRGKVAGLGGSTPRRDPVTGRLTYVTGTVALDSPDVHGLLTRPDGYALARAILMHELSHVVGLTHVPDDREIMSPENHGLTSWGPGDRRGLALLGEGRCQG
jgi:hypothetical protein